MKYREMIQKMEPSEVKLKKNYREAVRSEE